MGVISRSNLVTSLQMGSKEQIMQEKWFNDFIDAWADGTCSSPDGEYYDLYAGYAEHLWMEMTPEQKRQAIEWAKKNTADRGADEGQSELASSIFDLEDRENGKMKPLIGSPS